MNICQENHWWMNSVNQIRTIGNGTLDLKFVACILPVALWSLSEAELFLIIIFNKEHIPMQLICCQNI